MTPDTVLEALQAASAPLVLTVAACAGAGLTVSVAKWAWPIGVQMFKKMISR